MKRITVKASAIQYPEAQQTPRNQVHLVTPSIFRNDEDEKKEASSWAVQHERKKQVIKAYRSQIAQLFGVTTEQVYQSTIAVIRYPEMGTVVEDKMPWHLSSKDPYTNTPEYTLDPGWYWVEIFYTREFQVMVYFNPSNAFDEMYCEICEKEEPPRIVMVSETLIEALKKKAAEKKSRSNITYRK